MRAVRKKTTALILLLLGFLQGCLNPFAPPIDTSSSGESSYLEKTSPENVLMNFKFAYEHRNFDLYLDCLDRSFTFCYFDRELNRQNCYGLENSSVPGEKARTKALFSVYERITLDPWEILASYTEITDTETLYVRRVLFTLQVEDFDGSFPTSMAQGYAIFKLKRQKPPEENMFRIAFWNDESIGEK